ncbi:MAG: FG-GAP-like repeat-containing protein [Thermoanaerobaculia bacterium]
MNTNPKLRAARCLVLAGVAAILFSFPNMAQTLVVQPNLSTASQPLGIAIADFDGDGKADLAVGIYGGAKVSFFLNTGSLGVISFGTGFDISVGGGPEGIAAADLNGDGLIDLVTANAASETVSVLVNRSTVGALSFSRVDLPGGHNPHGVAIGDIDGDGLPDIVVTNNGGQNVFIYRNTSNHGTLSFAGPVSYALPSFPNQLALADLDGDGKLDILVPIGNNDILSVFRNTSTPGAISFVARRDFPTGHQPEGIAVADLDGDGRPDVLVPASGNGSLSVLLNKSGPGAIALASHADFPVGSSPGSVVVRDFDQDGRLDAVVANGGGNSFSLLRNTRVGSTLSFAPKIDFSTGPTPIRIAAGDLDGDGSSDLVVSNHGDSSVSLYRDSQSTLSCTPGSTTLCLNSGRFQVKASWRVASQGTSGVGVAVPLTGDTGYFWFFGSNNVEVVLKVLDGRAVNNHFWVFYGALSDVEYTITVTDTRTGAVKTYFNPQGQLKSVADTTAFSGGAAADREGATAAAGSQPDTPTTGREAPAELFSMTPYPGLEHVAATSTVCAAGPTALCLAANQFQVQVSWHTPQGASGVGNAVPLTGDTGYFWFFGSSNVELILKILDGRTVNNNFWVFYGALSDVEYTITITDTHTGTVKTYSNPQGHLASIADTAAFTPGGVLPPDPGPAGKLTLGGIDSDLDGVRDDLQRYIALTYGASPPTVDALRRTAKVIQGSILDSASSNASINHATDFARAIECLQSIRPTDANAVQEALVAEALNTEARGLAYLAFNDQLGGSSFPLSPPNQWAASCSVPATGDARALNSAITTGADTTSCQPATATVFFGNGVFNTCSDAEAGTANLAASVPALLPESERPNVSFATACNPTKGHVADLWRAVKQRFNSDFSAFYRGLANLDPMPDFMQQALISKSSEITSQAAVDDLALQDHIRQYKTEILEGRRVVVVAHSQGNFYANLASTALTSNELSSFGIVSVANPDNHVEGDWGWTTLFTDLIISAVPGALPWNTFNGTKTNLLDPSGHFFLASYMYPGSNSQNQILAQVKSELDVLQIPSNPAGNGIITITLTWDHATDVDLHVFEPDGTHVYYQQLQGDSGFLDFDNITGFGPEHYFVACDTLQAGTYHVGVNYYRGDSPETAHVEIRAGLMVRNFDISLQNALGPDGNGSPQRVADIVVTGSASTGFSFEVRPPS